MNMVKNFKMILGNRKLINKSMLIGGVGLTIYSLIKMYRGLLYKHEVVSKRLFTIKSLYDRRHNPNAGLYKGGLLNIPSSDKLMPERYRQKHALSLNTGYAETLVSYSEIKNMKLPQHSLYDCGYILEPLYDDEEEKNVFEYIEKSGSESLLDYEGKFFRGIVKIGEYILSDDDKVIFFDKTRNPFLRPYSDSTQSKVIKSIPNPNVPLVLYAVYDINDKMISREIHTIDDIIYVSNIKEPNNEMWLFDSDINTTSVVRVEGYGPEVFISKFLTPNGKVVDFSRYLREKRERNRYR